MLSAFKKKLAPLRGRVTGVGVALVFVVAVFDDHIATVGHVDIADRDDVWPVFVGADLFPNIRDLDVFAVRVLFLERSQSIHVGRRGFGNAENGRKESSCIEDFCFRNFHVMGVGGLAFDALVVTKGDGRQTGQRGQIEIHVVNGLLAPEPLVRLSQSRLRAIAPGKQPLTSSCSGDRSRPPRIEHRRGQTLDTERSPWGRMCPRCHRCSSRGGRSRSR